MNTLLRFCLPLLLFLISQMAFAQDAAIRGFVYDKESGEPVIFANVLLKGTSFGVTTDANGYYSLTKIAPGSYELVVSTIEYKIFSESITIDKGKIISRNILLEKSVIELGSAEVRADKQENETQVRMSVKTLTPREIKQLPSIGGTPDLAQYLQVLPGVVFTGDQGGQLYIRGGSPVQNKVLLDGMLVYNPFHSIGLFSVFDTDIISNADIYTGGFNAQFGGRISSVMDITTRDGNKKRSAGRVGISPFAARALVEGPLKKLGEQGGGISYILSVKHSFLEESSKLLYRYIDNDGLPFNFTDVYGKLSFGGARGSKFNVFGFNFSDQVKYKAISDLNWNNRGAGANFVLIPSGSTVLMNGYFSTSSYDITLKEENVPDRFSSIDGFNFGLDFKYVLGENEAKYGLEIVGFNTNFETFNPLGVKIVQEENTTEFGGFFVYKLSKGRFIAEPSIRLQYYSSLATLSPEPRLGLKYKVSEILRFKLAAGLYSQNLISANSDRDVVNLFYGFLAGPQDLQNEFVREDGEVNEVKNSLQRARHVILGSEFDLTEHISINTEAYYIDFRQLTNTNRNKLFPDNDENRDLPDELKKDFIIETGNSYGVDFVAKYDHKDLYVWLVYSIARVNRWDGFQSYAPVFDRRHNVNFVSSYSFGKDNRWEASARWNLGSGLPFTQTQGYYQPVDFSQGVTSDFIISNSDDLAIVYAELNGGRLPYYHRLDLNVKRIFRFTDKRNLEVNAGITNVYSRRNVFYIDRVSNERVDQLPFMPSLGIDFTF
jgi:hypothetical protein